MQLKGKPPDVQSKGAYQVDSTLQCSTPQATHCTPLMDCLVQPKIHIY